MLLELWEWLTTPLAPTVDAILPVYGLCLAATLTLAVLAHAAGADFQEPFVDWSYGSALIVGGGLVPLLEELAFRGLPLAAVASGVVGVSPTTAILAGSVVWLVLHGGAMVVLAPLGAVFAKLWLAGVPGGEAAIVVHALHNLVFITAAFGARRLQRARDRDATPSRDASAAHVDADVSVEASDDG